MPKPPFAVDCNLCFTLRSPPIGYKAVIISFSVDFCVLFAYNDGDEAPRTSVCVRKQVSQWEFLLFMKEMNKMEDVKEPRTFAQQLNKIKRRGCIVGDENYAKSTLEHINYYRLTAYFLPFKNDDGETYMPGTTFDKVCRIYRFDKELRTLIFSIIEEIELMLRTQLAYYHSFKYGPLGYMDETNFSKRHKQEAFIEQIETCVERNKNTLIVQHHQNKYGGNFPLWVIIEFFSVGQLSRFYADLNPCDQKAVAKNLSISNFKNMENWLHCLTILRNNCAHYSRLYGTVLLLDPRTPRSCPFKLQRMVFDYILVLKFLYFDPIRWREIFVPKFEALIEEYADTIDMDQIGFPENWNQLLLTQNYK